MPILAKPTARSTLALAAGLLAGALLTGPAAAGSISRVGPNGGIVAGSWDSGSGSASWTGPNGGSGSGSVQCFDGYVDRCHRSWTYTDPSGDTWSGGGTVAAGPYRGVVTRHVTGPEGNTAIYRGVWWR
jgi:hypothetical protein